jgi:glyoxylase-like metal-dependent hydrolase (beta-lactamase superfamily II)
MRRAIVPAILLLLGGLLVAPAAAETKPLDLVKAAVKAMGGAQAMRALKSAAITAEATHWEPEQSIVPDGEPRLVGNSRLAILWDFANDRTRTDWERTLLYPFPGAAKFSDVVTPGFGFVADEKGDQPMSARRLAVERREQERASPLLLLHALDHPEKLWAAPRHTLHRLSLPSVRFEDGAASFIILFDPKTHLPRAIRTLDESIIYGDAVSELVLDDWRSVGGVTIAHRLHWRLASRTIRHVTYTAATANPAIPSQAFEPSPDTQQAAAPPATGGVPYVKVMTRVNFTRFAETPAFWDSAQGLKLVELTPDVQFVQGATHNSMIVALRDYLVIIEAPQDDNYSRWVIDAAKAKYPGKPIRYVMVTHHHFDHSGGTRAFVAAGADVIVPAPAKAHFAALLAAPHTLAPDMLQKAPRRAEIIEVASEYALKDGAEEIRFIRVDNPHVEGMLIAHVVKANIVFDSDLYSPGRDKAKTPGNTAFLAVLKKLGLSQARIAGGHGGVGSAGDLDALAATQ